MIGVSFWSPARDLWEITKDVGGARRFTSYFDFLYFRPPLIFVSLFTVLHHGG